MNILNTIMKSSLRLILVIAAFAMPVCCFAASSVSNIETSSIIIGIVNMVVWITSAISIKQLFGNKDNNTSPFHVFNIVFVILFTWISLSYLITHKDYYEGYQHLSTADCIKKYYFSTDPISLLKRVIELGFICNLIYILRYGKDYYRNSD